MFGLGAGELFIIFFIALIFLGPKKLPGLARSMGKSIREFQRAINSNEEIVESENKTTDQVTSEVNDSPKTSH
jgi:sec-independent protein translocase protein TatA